MFTEGDVVQYNDHLYFVVANHNNGNYSICPVHRIDLFGTEKDRIVSIAKYSKVVMGSNLQLNESGSLE